MGPEITSLNIAGCYAMLGKLGHAKQPRCGTGSPEILLLKSGLIFYLGNAFRVCCYLEFRESYFKFGTIKNIIPVIPW